MNTLLVSDSPAKSKRPTLNVQRPTPNSSRRPLGDAGSDPTTIASQSDAATTLRRGWIFYDAQCRYCRGAAERFTKTFAKRGFEFVPLQTPWVQHRLGINPDTPLDEMRVLTTKDEDFGGADAVIFLARQIWWATPLALIARLPRFHALAVLAYRWIAANRGCDSGACEIVAQAARLRPPISSQTRRLRYHPSFDPPATLSRSDCGRGVRRSMFSVRCFLPLLFLVLGALAARPVLPPWAFMWAMVGALFSGFKWLTLYNRERALSLRTRLVYLLLWPGMDPKPFLGRGAQAASLPVSAACRNDLSLQATRAEPVAGKLPATAGWQPALPKDSRRNARMASAGLLNWLCGTILLFFVARLAPTTLLAGWIGMVGMILMVHFGVFHLAAAVWRAFGFPAKPIMNAPIKATSLADFWGRRWNAAFNQIVIGSFFRPVARKFGAIRATLIAFLVSGLLHELVISLPAGAGYGLPTAYFLLQGWGIILQRELPPKFSGRFLTILLTAGPAFLLFHPPFVERVIVPFLKVIHAL